MIYNNEKLKIKLINDSFENYENDRISYGFEIEKKFYDIAKEKMFINIQKNIFVK